MAGQRFVESLRSAPAGAGRWSTSADRPRPPASTEQVLHPDAYIDADAPMPVRLRAGSVLGDGWKRAVAGTWGELQTREMLAEAGGGGSARPPRAGAGTATSCGGAATATRRRAGTATCS